MDCNDGQISYFMLFFMKQNSQDGNHAAFSKNPLKVLPPYCTFIHPFIHPPSKFTHCCLCGWEIVMECLPGTAYGYYGKQNIL